MDQIYTPTMRVLVAVVLLAATAALLHVTVRTARAAGALAIGSCGAYGEAYDFHSVADASEGALARCRDSSCRIVATVKRGCAALAVDYANACGGHRRAPAPRRAWRCAPATPTAPENASSALFSATPRAESPASPAS